MEAKNIYADKMKNAKTFQDIEKLRAADKLGSMITKYEAHMLMQKSSLDDNCREWEKYLSLEEWTDTYWKLKYEFIENITLLEGI